MKRLMLLPLLAVFVVACTDPPSAGSTDAPQGARFMAVLTSDIGEYDGRLLTLKDVPQVVYFSDRPDRIVRHDELGSLAAYWTVGPDSLQANPPNATLSIYDADAVTVLELSEPQVSGQTIRFQAKVLAGDPPTSFRKSSLIIDAFPTSVNNQITD